MELSIKNFKTALNKEFIKKAEKNVVRECDEVKKGVYQAYVDEGNDTYDVSISINNKGIVTNQSCDCNSNVDFCRHETALLLYLSKPKKSTVKVKDAKKINQFELVVDDADPEILRAWVKDVLSKNKNLEIAFMHQFSDQQKQHTPSEVNQITMDAVKAVVGTRKKIEVSEVKKIVDLWNDLHEKFVVQYRSNVTDKHAFLNLDALMMGCEEALEKIITSSKELHDYKEKLLTRIVESLHSLENEDSWDVATGYFNDQMVKEVDNFRVNYLMLLTRLFENSDIARKERLAASMLANYKQHKKQKFYQDQLLYMEAMLGILKNTGLFKANYELFTTDHFTDDYNQKFISALIDSGYLAIAEKYCWEQIDGNYRQERSENYLLLLKKIFTIKVDNKKLAEILKELVPKTFDIDDYLFVASQLKSDEEKKKWRTKIMGKAGNHDYDKKAKIFQFALLDHEQQYIKMIGEIDRYTSYSTIAQYAEKMLMEGKKIFLQRVVEIDDSFGSNMGNPDEAVFSEIMAAVDRYLQRNEIELIVRQSGNSNRYYDRNKFITFIKRRIGLQE